MPRRTQALALVAQRLSRSRPARCWTWQPAAVLKQTLCAALSEPWSVWQKLAASVR